MDATYWTVLVTVPESRTALQIFAGPLIFTYVRDGELVITIDTEEMDRPPLPVRVNVNSAVVWTGTVVGPDEREED